ncbi:MAG: TIGR03086 family metal-binding protein [Acidimicrobiia bacterium]|nr:TIGR03086 family metal-binding protein [Acidimicrobiia bacterium]
METKELEQAFASTRSVLENVSPDQMNDPTPCQSWKVNELVNHIVGGAKWFGSVVESGASDDDGSDLPDFAGGDYLAAFDQGVKGSVAGFGKPDAADKMLTLPFGAMPGSAFYGLATTDTFVHRWDLAKATGQGTDLEPELAQMLLDVSRENLEDSWRGPDPGAPFGPEQEAPDGASTADQLAAFLGRTV